MSSSNSGSRTADGGAVHDAVPIDGNPWLIAVTYVDDDGARSTVVINTATGDAAWFRETVALIRNRRLLGSGLISPRSFALLNGAYRQATGRRLRKPPVVCALEALSDRSRSSDDQGDSRG